MDNTVKDNIASDPKKQRVMKDNISIELSLEIQGNMNRSFTKPPRRQIPNNHDHHP